MITLEDVLGELLGSVPDEFKAPRLLPLRLTDGRVRLPGDLPLERARVLGRRGLAHRQHHGR